MISSNVSIVLVALIGLTISCLSIYVEHEKQRNSQYEAFCDINDKISCSDIFFSE